MSGMFDGWICGNCGAKVPMTSAHTCSSRAMPVPVDISPGPWTEERVAEVIDLLRAIHDDVCKRRRSVDHLRRP